MVMLLGWATVWAQLNNLGITKTKVNSAFYLSSAGKSSMILLDGYVVKARCVHLCQVAGKTV